MMGWMHDLIYTYDANLSSINVRDFERSLMPIAHSTQNAQIEIVIDENGNFLSANEVAKEDAVTLIPVSENSASRTNKPTPHPLFDKLCYIAGDYAEYIVEDDKEVDYTEYYNLYISSLKEWAYSPYSHKKIIAIYHYLSKKKVIKDLVGAKVLQLDKQGKLKKGVKKIQGIEQVDAFVRFIVRSFDLEPTTEKVWEDEEVVNCYIDYYTSMKMKEEMEKDLCYVLGSEDFITTKHPKKIRHSGDQGKIISANDNEGFTFLGRFKNSHQANSVSFIASQKAHNALRWLIQKQGYRNQDQVIVAWAIDGSEIPDITKDSYDLFPGFMEGWIDTGEGFAKRLKKALKGYRENLTTNQKVVVMALDSATQGRLSIIFYREINGSDFLERVEKWQKDTSWHHIKYDGRSIQFTGSPSLREIAKAAFVAKGGQASKSDEKIIKSTIERLFLCIVDGSRVPLDIVRALVNMVTYQPKNEGNWGQKLSIACSIIKKHRKDRYKEEWDVSLDKSCDDRNYLFGRLLAIADWIEILAMQGESDRLTNAMRYMSAFAKRPGKTWQIIYQNLIPYFNRLYPGQRVKYQKLIDEIGTTFKPGEFNNRPLNELYLLGFYSQKFDLRSNKLDENIEVEIEDVES